MHLRPCLKGGLGKGSGKGLGEMKREKQQPALVAEHLWAVLLVYLLSGCAWDHTWDHPGERVRDRFLTKHHFQALSTSLLHLALSLMAPTLSSLIEITLFVLLNLNFKLTDLLASFLPVSVLVINFSACSWPPPLLTALIPVISQPDVSFFMASLNILGYLW